MSFRLGQRVLVLGALCALVPLASGASEVCADVQSTWRQLQRTGYDGVVAFRCRIEAGAANDPAILVGRPAYGRYEVFADGHLIGRSAGFTSSVAFGFPSVFRLPRAGSVDITFQVRRIGWISDLDPESGPVSGELEIGSFAALESRVRADWQRKLLSEVPLLLLAAIFAASAFHHLLLFGWRRQQVEHLWFGLLAFVFAANTFASTYWIYELTPSRAIATRVADATGHLAAALAIQFLWTFFWRRIPPALRIYQLSHVALALLVALWPGLRLVIMSATVRWLWLLPLLVIAAVYVLREGWRGDGEARLIAAGGVTMVIVEAAELLRNVSSVQLPFDFSLAPFGFAAVIIAMSLAVSVRIRRAREELEHLRLTLEDQVRERTRELAAARDDALAGLRVKSEFLANISHEIRTPMNGVIGVAELLARTPLNEAQRAHLESIEVSSRSLLSLLDDIIDFSRLESNALAIEHRPFRIRDVVDDCLEIVLPLARAKALLLTSSVAEGTVAAISGDERRTRQVLLNLLSNAVKFTEHGRIAVDVRSRPLDGDRFEVRFSVTYSGRGISGEDIGRLFVAFQQLDGSSTRKYGGAGLGLAISKRLTALMGGEMTVESAPGRGSTFHFTITGERAEVPARLAAVKPEPVMAVRRPLRVLLAEDDQVNQIVILDMLEQLGHHADPVNDGIEALRALERDHYDVVLMDVQMPGLDGFEVTRRIRSERGDGVYIIALTAHALDGDRERCLAAGMNDYLSKPVRMADVQRVFAARAPRAL